MCRSVWRLLRRRFDGELRIGIEKKVSVRGLFYFFTVCICLKKNGVRILCL